MAVVGIVEVLEEPGGLDTADLAYELVDLNTRLTALTTRWLALLAEFDRREVGERMASSRVWTGSSGGAV